MKNFYVGVLFACCLLIAAESRAQFFDFTNVPFELVGPMDDKTYTTSGVYTENGNSLRLTVQESGRDACASQIAIVMNGELFISGCGAGRNNDIHKSVFIEKTDQSAFTPVETTIIPYCYRPNDTSPYETAEIELIAFDGANEVGRITMNGLLHSQRYTIQFKDHVGFKNITRLQVLGHYQDFALDSYGDPGTLPVRMTAFNASQEANRAILKWQTTSEINAGSFEIEKSFDGKSFIKIGHILAAGNSAATINYEYSDIIQSADAGFVYYRLKMNDLDGKFSYSRIRSLFFKNMGEKATMLYPNPAADFINLDFPLHIRQADVQIVSVNGANQINKTLSVDQGKATVSLENLISGSYVMSVIYGNNRSYIRFIKK